MRKIYSKVDPGVLLHVVVRKGDITNKRMDLSQPEEFLQVGCKKIEFGDVFPAHFHIDQPRQIGATQESWVIIDGRVRVNYYDIDNTWLGDLELNSGDCWVTLRGGHAMEVLDDAILYEFKNGPYNGKAKDKEMIDV